MSEQKKPETQLVKVEEHGALTIDFGKILVDVAYGGGSPECSIADIKISIRPVRSVPECS